MLWQWAQLIQTYLNASWKLCLFQNLVSFSIQEVGLVTCVPITRQPSNGTPHWSPLHKRALEYNGEGFMGEKIYHLVNVLVRVVKNSGSKSRENWFPANPWNVISFSEYAMCSCNVSHSLISCLSYVHPLVCAEGLGLTFLMSENSADSEI